MSVRQDDDLIFLAGFVSFLADRFQLVDVTGYTFAGGIGNINDVSAPVAVVDLLEDVQIGDGNDGILKPEPVYLFRAWLKDVIFRSDRTVEGHDDFLTEWIDGRIGDLSEELFEVFVRDWREV